RGQRRGVGQLDRARRGGQRPGGRGGVLGGRAGRGHRQERHHRVPGAPAADPRADLSYVQFQLLARLADAHGPLTMTQLADALVYSRSGLTYQAGLLEKAGLITRGPSPDDERATLVTITGNGRARFDRVLPGHVQVIRRLLVDPLTDDDLHYLGDIMTRV